MSDDTSFSGGGFIVPTDVACPDCGMYYLSCVKVNGVISDSCPGCEYSKERNEEMSDDPAQTLADAINEKLKEHPLDKPVSVQDDGGGRVKLIMRSQASIEVDRDFIEAQGVGGWEDRIAVGLAHALRNHAMRAKSTLTGEPSADERINAARQYILDQLDGADEDAAAMLSEVMSILSAPDGA